MAYENVYKNVQKCYKIFKLRLLNVLNTGKYVVKIWLSLCFTGCVRFAWNFGELYNRHLFSDGELHFSQFNYYY